MERVEYTIVLKSEQPRPNLFDFFEDLNIQGKDILEGPDAKSKSVGTGPFALSEWIQGDRLVLKKNPNYWQSGRPYVDSMEVKILSDTQAAVVQLNDLFLDESFLMVLSSFPARVLARSTVQNIMTNAHGGYTFTHAWLG